ncbi:uncharacterized protein C8Q71DRAFT_776509 [Rhodofomes roseus]|uniref:Uncharacterized protein n=1 Tax=Rhodofomes roseus TaxID=34475 RepID=A0ABQ8K5V5_9APHY|nr:uncharacterized protein C8Q71DRAFT_776509 [Rhodofomes roseus]KAH9832473.1 hypothetical protein C8Q71DRAFT_776509 [Rhodofomes roseus]
MTDMVARCRTTVSKRPPQGLTLILTIGGRTYIDNGSSAGSTMATDSDLVAALTRLNIGQQGLMQPALQPRAAMSMAGNMHVAEQCHPVEPHEPMPLSLAAMQPVAIPLNAGQHLLDLERDFDGWFNPDFGHQIDVEQDRLNFERDFDEWFNPDIDASYSIDNNFRGARHRRTN